jgi:hypothetical protein
MSQSRKRLIAAALLTALALPSFAQELPTYSIQRAAAAIEVDGRLDEPAWLAAPDVGRFQFPWWQSGKKEQTVAKLLWDDRHLYVAYLCQDAHIWAEHKERDSPVYRDDCVEIFISPDPARPAAYINIEMNVLGVFLDQFRSGVPGEKVQEDWSATGVRIATKIAGTLNDDSDEDRHWVLEAAIPLENYTKALKIAQPKPGDMWRVNLNRLGGKTNTQHSQWSPGNTPRPAFHVPERFGTMIFSEKSSPF